MDDINSRREILHGKKLAQGNPELTWGWGSPAGKLRAKRRAKLIVNGTNLRSGMHVLEIGCGTGLFTEMFAQTGARLTAVDISPDLLDKAKEKGLSNVQFLEKRFEDCDADGPFDAVVGVSVLHHLDIKTSLTKIYSLLKPDGFISFSEPNMMNPQVMLQKNVPWIKRCMGDSPHETAFIRWRFRRLLLKAGFKNVKIIPFDWLHPATPKVLIPIIKKLGFLLENTPGLKEFAGSLYIRARRPVGLR